VSATESLRAWTRFLNRDVLADLHGHVVNALAAMSFAVAVAGHCQSGRVACGVPLGRATPASVRRRWERLLGNARLAPDAVFARLCRSLAAAWGGCGREVVIIVDETDRDARLRSLRVCVGYRRRALPLLSLAYRPDAPPRPLPELLVRQLGRVRRWLGGAVEVTLLADRGLAWPQVVRACQRWGWHYVLRAQKGTRVRLSGSDRDRALGDLAPRRRGGRPFVGRGRVFKGEGWIDGVSVTAVWERRCKEPWLLLGDRPGGYARCRQYARRMWCEQSFRDEKAQGFHWDASRVDDPRRATRLLVLLALATLLCVATGVRVVKRGLRRTLDAHRARRWLSYFQLGLRWLRWATQCERPIPLLGVSLVPP